MARSIRISEKNAQRLADYMGSDSRDPLAWPEREALEELQRALDRKPPSGLRQAGRKAKRKAFGLRPGRYRAWEVAPSNEARASSVVARATQGLAPVSEPRRPTKAEKRDETAAIRTACLKRAGAFCECGCGRPLALSEYATATFVVSAAPELDHFFGRGKGRPPQSVETCWILRADCHRRKTLGDPSAAVWLRLFAAHCRKQRLLTDSLAARDRWGEALALAEKRLAFVETRSALPAAPRSTP